MSKRRMLILTIIAEKGPIHSYGIIVEAEKRGDSFGVPSLYEHLRELLNENLVTREECLVPKVGKRFCYRITDDGTKALNPAPKVVVGGLQPLPI